MNYVLSDRKMGAVMIILVKVSGFSSRLEL